RGFLQHLEPYELRQSGHQRRGNVCLHAGCQRMPVERNQSQLAVRQHFLHRRHATPDPILFALLLLTVSITRGAIHFAPFFVLPDPKNGRAGFVESRSAATGAFFFVIAWVWPLDMRLDVTKANTEGKLLPANDLTNPAALRSRFGDHSCLTQRESTCSSAKLLHPKRRKSTTRFSLRAASSPICSKPSRIARRSPRASH